MTSIGGPGGIGGPKGPGGPGGPGDVDGPDGAGDIDGMAGPNELDATAAGAVGRDAGIERAAAAGGTDDIDALAAEVAAGRLTPHEALQRLVDATAGPDLGPAERAELRELLTDLVASDPYLSALAGRI
jgi:hypothetical protein